MHEGRVAARLLNHPNVEFGILDVGVKSEYVAYLRHRAPLVGEDSAAYFRRGVKQS